MTKGYPLIGIPCRTDTSGTYGRPINTQSHSYLEAVVRAGGIPVLIPVQVQGDRLAALLERVDGFLFAGGSDLDPARYGESPQVRNLTDIQPERDELELKLINLALAERRPFFAICRGLQVMNVAAGGSLWQDLASQNPQAQRHDFYYDNAPFARNYLAHEVALQPGSLLGRLLGTERLAVNSLHHQGVKTVPGSLRATGHTADGLVEVLEAPDHPFGLGVQWHPEELLADQPEALRIFAAFIEAARGQGY